MHIKYAKKSKNMEQKFKKYVLKNKKITVIYVNFRSNKII